MEIIAIIGAMDSEIKNLKNNIKNIEETEIAGILFYKGKLCDKDIVLLKSGIGKVNSAVAATIAIERFKVKKIIFTGVAGSANPNYNIADIVISKDLIEHDFDTSALDGDELTVLVKGYDTNYYPADKYLIELAKVSAERVIKNNKVYIDTIATGDQFIGDRTKVKYIQEKFKAGAIEMEGASVSHVSLMYKIPVVEASENSTKIVIEMLKNIK